MARRSNPFVDALEIRSFRVRSNKCNHSVYDNRSDVRGSEKEATPYDPVEHVLRVRARALGIPQQLSLDV
jgi:hypothetical protein